MLRRLIIVAVGLVALFGTGVVFGEVGLSINLGLPVPQNVVVGPNGVYFLSNPGVNAFFYSGFWWVPRGGVWYRASDYDGRWVVVEPRVVPVEVIRVYDEPSYRIVYKERMHIPYGQWKKQGYLMKEVIRSEPLKDMKPNKGKHGLGHGRGHGRGLD